MSNFRKYVAVPAEMETNETSTQTPGGILRQRKERTTNDRLGRILKIVLKLSKKQAFDEEYRVKRDDGTYVNNSNIISLLNHCMSHGKLLNGLPEFVKLLHESNIDPELIINENVKAKLYALIHKPVESDDKAIQTENENSNTGNIDMETQPKVIMQSGELKRKHDDDDLDNSEPVPVKPSKQPKLDSGPVWDITDDEPGIKPWEVSLPDDSDTDL